MDVGALSYGGKGKGKKGMKVWTKDFKGKKGKDRSKAKNERFQGECGFCGVWGHMRNECRRAAERREHVEG